MITEIPSCILSQYLWCNTNIQVNKTSIQFSRFSEKNINYVSQLFKNNGSIKKWHEFKREYDLHQNSYFQWVQLIDCSRKMEIYHKTNNEVVANLITHDHHLFFSFFFFFSMEMNIYTLNIKTIVTWQHEFYGCQGYKKKY